MKTNMEDIAYRIARSYGEEPQILKVKMIGTEDVRKFIAMLKEAQEHNHKRPLKLC